MSKGRIQKVTLNDNKSPERGVISRVPQSSLLRPILICQIIGDLNNKKLLVYVYICRQAQENSQILKTAIDKGKEQISVRTLLFRTSQLKSNGIAQG